MITGEHGVIRSAEVDDLYELQRLYDPDRPRSVFLDRRRELHYPTSDELRDMLTRREIRALNPFLAVEDPTGMVRGFCMIRGITTEGSYCELFLGFLEEGDYGSPLAAEALRYLLGKAFHDHRLNKIMGHCLDTESELRRLLVAHGFESDGVQRDMVFTLGRYHDLETLSRFREAGETAG